MYVLPAATYCQEQYKMIVHTDSGDNVFYTEMIDSITFLDMNVQWTDDNSLNCCIEEFYMDNFNLKYGRNCYIGAFESGNCSPRLFIYNQNDQLIAQLKEDASNWPSDYYAYESFSSIIDVNTRETIGFIKLRNNVTYSNSGFKAFLNDIFISDIHNNPQIGNILKGDNQIVLLGDSKFGQYWSNFLPDMLMGLARCRVYNCGFGGCRMAWRSIKGTDPYDLFSFSSICDAIVNKNFVPQTQMMPLSDYRYQTENLKSIDFNKRTTIIVNYGTNDITGGSALKVLDSIPEIMEDLDRTNFVDAIVYGVRKVKNKYPNVNFVFLSPDFRVYEGKGIDEFVNEHGFGIWDYYEAMKNTVHLLDCIFVDSYYLDFRTSQNIMDYTVDGVHNNGPGFSKYAQFLYYTWLFNCKN